MSLVPFIKRLAFYYLPVLLWSGGIFYLSSVPELKVGAQEVAWEIIIRKLAHIGEYTILAILCMRAVLLGDIRRYKKALAYSLLFVLTFSVSDELHQTYVAGRTGRRIDVLIDILGAMAGFTLF